MIAWGLNTAFAVSALILLVLVLRGPVARAFGARAAYALWLAPALRAVTPPLPEGAVPVPASVVNADYWIATTAEANVSGPSLTAVLVGLWLVGALLFLGLHLWRHHRFVTQALSQSRPLHLPGIAYDVVASGAVDGPLATGLIHPIIIVPLDFEQRFSPEQQRFALWHEQLHHRRGDIWATAAALILTSLLWFNPIAHLALGAFRRDMEAACDARLLAEAGPSAAPAYASTILRCAARPVPRSLCALTAIDELKGRLNMLKANHGPARRLSGLLLAAGIAVGGVTVASPAAADEPKETRKFVKKIEVHKSADGKDVLGSARRGDLEKMALNCPGEKFETALDGAGDRKEAIKFFVCTEKGEGAEGMARALEKALADLGEHSEMSPAAKADLAAKLRAKIQSLRTGG